MKKRIIQKKTCFAIGMAGAVCGFACGVLQAVSTGPAELLWRISFVLYGAMLLFLATTERGVENRTRRVQLLLIFIALLISYFNLPILCPVLEAIVLPLLGLMYKLPENKNRAAWRVLVLCEAVYVVVRSIMIMPSYASVAALALGLSLALVSAARFWLLWNLYRNAAAQPAEVAEPMADKLKTKFYPEVQVPTPTTQPAHKD